MQLAEQFDRAAGRYDLLTRLNPGYHGELRGAADALVAALAASGRVGLTLWDLGCGSGLSTQALIDAIAATGTAAATTGITGAARPRVVGLDASAGMLGQARAKDWPDGVSFVHAVAQDLPEVAARELGGSADGAFAAYLLRNVPEGQRDAVVQAIHDQVRPGGWVVLQDYHVKGDPVATAVWNLVCSAVVTPLAFAVRGNPAIYRYLRRSVLLNDSTAELQARLERAGFADITWRTARGWQRGILHTVLARRPEAREHAHVHEGGHP